ncbi:1499_t:CDS:1, partial [Acaulospora colombiana]
MLWQRAWWVDSAAALIFSIFFAKEGYEMVIWASSKNFTGGYMHDETKNDNKREISSQEVSEPVEKFEGRDDGGGEIYTI